MCLYEPVSLKRCHPALCSAIETSVLIMNRLMFSTILPLLLHTADTSVTSRSALKRITVSTCFNAFQNNALSSAIKDLNMTASVGFNKKNPLDVAKMYTYSLSSFTIVPGSCVECGVTEEGQNYITHNSVVQEVPIKKFYCFLLPVSQILFQIIQKVFAWPNPYKTSCCLKI